VEGDIIHHNDRVLDWKWIAPWQDLELHKRLEGCYTRLLLGIYYKPGCRQWYKPEVFASAVHVRELGMELEKPHTATMLSCESQLVCFEGTGSTLLICAKRKVSGRSDFLCLPAYI
jgi:hypothetical protein